MAIVEAMIERGPIAVNLECFVDCTLKYFLRQPEIGLLISLWLIPAYADD